MTAVAGTARPVSLVRAAGVLFAVRGLVTVGLFLLVSGTTGGSGDTGNSMNGILPALLLGAIALLASPAAYLLLFLWLPKTAANSSFLLLAIASALSFLIATLPSSAMEIVDVVIAIVALFAGALVVVRRMFPRITSILFLVAMVLAWLPILLAPAQTLGESNWISSGALASLGYLLIGIALFLWPRTTSTTTA